MKRRLFVLAAALVSFFALVVSASACHWGAYQPEEPSELRD